MLLRRSTRRLASVRAATNEAFRAHRWSRSVHFEVLEQRQLLASITNGRFNVSDDTSSAYGWSVSGDATVEVGQGIIGEDAQVFSGFRQSFTIPTGALALQFTLARHDLRAGLGTPPDAFEAALLDATGNGSLVPVVEGLSGSDAFINLQSGGQLFRGSTSSVAGLEQPNATTDPNAPLVIRVSLAGVTAGTQATLYFDLLGFGVLDSIASVDDVTIIGADPPPLDFHLAPASDSGAQGDFFTRHTTVAYFGHTDPLATVLLDVDNDGFDDGSTTAALDGSIAFTNVILPIGTSSVRMRAGGLPGATVVEHATSVDNLPPRGQLVFPAPGTVLAEDVGYVDVQWLDSGAAGIQTTSIQLADLSITGVTLDRSESLGNDTFRYFYGDDDDLLPAGEIQVHYAADGISDLVGNLSQATSDSMSAVLLLRAGRDLVVPAGADAALSGAKFTYAGDHTQLTLDIDWKDGPIASVALAPGAGGAGIAASHAYATAGARTAQLTLRGPGGLLRTDEIAVTVLNPACGFHNPIQGLDVNNDGYVSPVDALLIINALNAHGPKPLSGVATSPPFYDVDCNNFLVPLDAVLVINELNSNAVFQGETAPSVSLATAPSPEEWPLDQGVDRALLNGDSAPAPYEESAALPPAMPSMHWPAAIDYLLGTYQINADESDADEITEDEITEDEITEDEITEDEITEDEINEDENTDALLWLNETH